MLIDLATHGLFDHCLTAASTIVDLGANQGDFAAAASSRFGCRIIAIEPNPEVYGTLRARCPKVQSMCAAIGKSDGRLTLHVSDNSQASTLRPVCQSEYVSTAEVEVVAFSTLCARFDLGTIDLLKVDIEGYEVELFAGMSDEQLQSIGQISIELHDFNGMITVLEADQIEYRLLELGFKRIALSRTNRENLLFYQPSRCKVGAIADLWARYVSRNCLGIQRIANRVIRRRATRVKP